MKLPEKDYKFDLAKRRLEVAREDMETARDNFPGNWESGDDSSQIRL